MFCGSNKYSLRYNKTDTKIKGKMKKKSLTGDNNV